MGTIFINFFQRPKMTKNVPKIQPKLKAEPESKMNLSISDSVSRGFVQKCAKFDPKYRQKWSLTK
jgi:hypothetical protein